MIPPREELLAPARPTSADESEARVDVVLLDSRDSFTFNLAQAFGELGASVRVVAAGDISAPHVLALSPRLVCIGPGPRGPRDMPVLVDTCRELTGVVPLLGVCLGMQALAIAHGGEVARALAPVHGQRAAITHEDSGLFRGLPSPLWVMRYHSLVVTRAPLGFRVDARDAFGQAMAMSDASRGAYAVQFHPESIGTSGGLDVLASALEHAGVVRPPLRYRPGSVPPPGALGSKVPHATPHAAP